MEQKRAEIEQMFAECEQAHKDSVKLSRIAFVVGIIAVVLCGTVGVLQAFRGKPFWSFIEFFLCLVDAAMVRDTYKRRKEGDKDWAEFEARHRFLMEHWEEIANESDMA